MTRVWLHRLSLAQLAMVAPRGHYQTVPRSVVVLSHGVLPTTDMYLAARLAELGVGEPRYVDTRIEVPAVGLFPDGAFVIVVRHAPRRWLRVLAASASRLSGVVWLLDDDIPGVLASTDLPLHYALRTASRYLVTRDLLARLCHEVWVSTAFLRDKYAAARPRLLQPLYLGAPFHAKAEAVTYFYHGTAAHRLELEFLVGVVRRVQARLENAHFEVIGDEGTRDLFRGIPRVRVQHPMTWPDFLAYTSGVHHAVGLAPMLDSQFNRARSHNKLYDITRAGAVGIYSDLDIYREHVRDGVNGLLLANDEATWAEAVCRLLGDAPVRLAMQREAQAWCEGQRHDPCFRLRAFGDET
ncbi:MAG: glycosyltransferase family 4 protein [Thiobacillus sp.]|nr:glycosyltransferase family 4 protein [Thiobacillus sp.]